jgi:hypothetical protein
MQTKPVPKINRSSQAKHKIAKQNSARSSNKVDPAPTDGRTDMETNRLFSKCT